MAYCVGSDIAAFGKGEGLDLAAIPGPGEVDAAWCLRFLRAIRDVAFLVTGACIGCGTCAAACPAQCIEAGYPYVIDQSHCLRCGICHEACPVQAIVKQ